MTFYNEYAMAINVLSKCSHIVLIEVFRIKSKIFKQQYYSNETLASLLNNYLWECGLNEALYLCHAFPTFHSNKQEASKRKFAEFIRIRCKPMKI